MDTIEARKDRWRRIMGPDSAPGFVFMVREPPEPSAPPAVLPNPENRSKWLDLIRWTYEYQIRRMKEFDDDLVPHLSMLTGTEIFAEAFGCPVHRPPDNMPFALPAVSDSAGAGRLRVPELSSSSVAPLFAMADKLRAEFGPGAVFRLPDLQSPMDVASLIWDKNTLYDAMLDEPGAVKELAGKVKVFMESFLDEWFRRYGTSCVAHYPDYYLEKCVSFSVDEVGAVSTDMFDSFFRDELEELSGRYGGLGVHCCAAARHQWGKFRALKGLRLVNIGLFGTIEEVTRAFPSVLHWHNWRPDGPVSGWKALLPANAKLVLEVYPPSRADGSVIAGEIRALQRTS
jgi:hypothetical protein